MSRAITHFAIGAALTALAVTLLPGVPYPRTVVLLGGGWALVPDAAKLVSHPWLRAFHRSRWADVFWFHRTLDGVDRTDSTRVASAALALLILVTAVVEWWSYSVHASVGH
jgi:hypothetical protein